jgi:hypothetical protein
MENPTKTIRFRSYSARVIDSVFVNDTLIYLTIAGQEDGIKAMTALMMQGRVCQDEHRINLNGRLGFQINKAGNRRLLEPIGEGYAHCALFHESVLPSNGMRVLLADNEAEAFVRFQQFLESACPLPRLVSLAADSRLEREAFDSLKQTSVIAKADVTAGDKVAYSVNTERLFKDDYLLLRETMIDIVDRFYSERDSLGILSLREVTEVAAEQRSRKAKVA